MYVYIRILNERDMYLKVYKVMKMIIKKKVNIALFRKTKKRFRIRKHIIISRLFMTIFKILVS